MSNLIVDIVGASKSCCNPAIKSLDEIENEYFFTEARKFVDEFESIATTTLENYRKVLTYILDIPEVEDIRSNLLKKYNELVSTVQLFAPKLGRCLIAHSSETEMIQATDLNVKLRQIIAKANTRPLTHNS